MAKMRLKVGEAISDVVLQVVKGTRKTYQKTTAQRSKHNGLREREEDAADCTSRLKMDAFSKNFFLQGDSLYRAEQDCSFDEGKDEIP